MSVDKLAVIVITDGLRRDSIEAQSTPAMCCAASPCGFAATVPLRPRSRAFVLPRSQRAAIHCATN